MVWGYHLKGGIITTRTEDCVLPLSSSSNNNSIYGNINNTTTNTPAMRSIYVANMPCTAHI